MPIVTGRSQASPFGSGSTIYSDDVAEAIYQGALRRRRLLVLSNINWRARLLARWPQDAVTIGTPVVPPLRSVEKPGIVFK